MSIVREAIGYHMQLPTHLVIFGQVCIFSYPFINNKNIYVFIINFLTIVIFILLHYFVGLNEREEKEESCKRFHEIKS